MLLALTAAAAFSGSAYAADLPARMPMKAPAPIAPIENWTGLWISGGFGYGLIDIDRSVTSFAVPGAVFDSGHDTGGRGWLGKIGGGGDYQFAGPFGTWVVGAFADAQWSNIGGRTTFFCPGGCAGPFEFNGPFKNDYSWAVGARIGYVALPGLLTYFNGGFTQAHFTQTNFVTAGAVPAVTGLALPSNTRNGYFLGGGTEYAIRQFPGLFWKSEYRFADYGNRDQNQVCVVTGTCGVAGTFHSIDHSKVFEQTATTELVYRFNWGGPMVAKY
jgi:outer membrane immunogenic protein